MKNFKKILIMWLPLALAVTMIMFTVEVVVQQNYRTSANDPQIQVSQDIAASFTDVKNATNLVPSDKTDISASLATFGIVYDKNGGLLASSANLDNQTPALPSGVIDTANKKGSDRFTWQPKSGVRIAAVITKANAGYVLIGRNIREVETRETALGLMILIAWLGTLAATFAAIWILDWFDCNKSGLKLKTSVAKTTETKKPSKKA